MKVLCIVSALGEKAHLMNVKSRADESFMDELTLEGITYAKKFYKSRWVLFSTKYGFLYPFDLIPTKKIHIPKNKDTWEYRAYIHKLRQQAKEKMLHEYDVIITLCSKEHIELIKEIFKDKTILNPLKEFDKVTRIERIRTSLIYNDPMIYICI